jgi:hypothetical protein
MSSPARFTLRRSRLKKRYNPSPDVRKRDRNNAEAYINNFMSQIAGWNSQRNIGSK